MRASPAPRASERSADKNYAAEAKQATVNGGASHGAAANGHASHAANGSATPRHGGETIEQCVLRTLEQYFKDLDGARPHRLHDMVLQATERPLLKFALARCEGNQSAAADLLGINRNTLRKKLVEHGFAEAPEAPKAPARSARKTAAKRSAAAGRKR